MEMSKEFKALVAHFNRVKRGFSPSDQREFIDYIEREQRREILKQQEEAKKKASARKSKALRGRRGGGGRGASATSTMAAIDSRRGGLAKSLMTRKLMPKT